MPAAFAVVRPATRRKIEHYEPGDAAGRLARRVQVGTEEKAPRRDGATMSASPVKTSSPAAARVHSVVEVARLVLKKWVSRCITPVRMSAKGRTGTVVHLAF